MSRQRLRQSFIEWKTELSNASYIQKLFYRINDELNKTKKNSINLRINPYIKFYLLNNFQKEVSNIEFSRKIKININEDNALSNSEIVFEDAIDVKKTNSKLKKKPEKRGKSKPINKKIKKETKKTSERKVSSKNKSLKSPLKEIKDKKTGWWQK